MVVSRRDLVAVPLGQEGERPDLPDRSRKITDREGRVTADDQAIGAAGEPGQERGLVVRDRVEVEALDGGLRRAPEAERGAEVLLADAKADGDTLAEEGQRAAQVSEADPQPRAALDETAVDEPRRGDGGVDGKPTARSSR